MLFDFANVAGFFGFALLGDELIDFCAQVRVVRHEIVNERMLGRKLHRGRAIDGVDAGGENADGGACRTEAFVIFR